MTDFCDYASCIEKPQPHVKTTMMEDVCHRCYGLYLLDRATHEVLKKQSGQCDHCSRSNLFVILFEVDYFYCCFEHQTLDVERNYNPKKLKLCSSGCCTNQAPLQCARCKNQNYCSKECQKKDWNFHKQNCKPIRKGPLFTTWCWDQISYFLPVVDVVSLSKVNKNLLLTSWFYLLKRDYPYGYKIATIESITNAKEYYKELYLDKITIDEYISIANTLEIESNATSIVKMLLKLIAKGRLTELVPLISHERDTKKQIRYLDWCYQLVKSNTVTLDYGELAIHCWNIYQNSKYTMWWLHKALVWRPLKFLHVISQFDTALSLEEKQELYWTYTQVLKKYNFSFMMWMVEQYKTKKEYAKAIALLEEANITRSHTLTEQEKLWNRLGHVLFFAKKFKAAYKINKLVAKSFPKSRVMALLYMIELRLNRLEHLPKTKKLLDRLSEEKMSDVVKGAYNQCEILYYLKMKDYVTFIQQMTTHTIHTLDSFHDFQCLRYYYQQQYQEGIHAAHLAYYNVTTSHVTRYLARCYCHLNQWEKAKETLCQFQEGIVQDLEWTLLYASTGCERKASLYWQRVLKCQHKENVSWDFDETYSKVKILIKNMPQQTRKKKKTRSSSRIINGSDLPTQFVC